MSQSGVLPPGIEAGSLGKRFVSYLIDALVPAIVGGGVGAFLSVRPDQDATVVLVLGIAAAIVILGWAVLCWWMLAAKGATPGMKAMKLQFVGLRDGKPVGWGRALLRQLVLGVLAGTTIGGIVLIITIVTNVRNQGLHDQAAKGVVIKQRVRGPQASTSSIAQAAPATQAPSGAAPVGLPDHLKPDAGFAGQGQDWAGFAPPADYQSSFGAGQQQQAAAPQQYQGTPQQYQGAPQFGQQPGSSQPAQHGMQQAPNYPQGPSFQPTPAGYGQPAPQQQPYHQAPAQAQSAPQGQHPAPMEQQGQAPQPQQAPFPQQASQGVPPQVAQPYGQPQSAPAHWGDSPVAAEPSWAPPSGEATPAPITSVPAFGGPESAAAQVPEADHRVAADPLAAVGAPGVEQPAADDEFPDDGTRIIPRAGSRAPDQGWKISLEGGRVVDVTGLVLIGRNPQPREGEEHAELVAVGEDARTVSKTHLAVGVDSRGIYVTDRGSTNGSAIANANGEYEPCQPGEVVRVREGQVVTFGEHRLEIQRSYL